MDVIDVMDIIDLDDDPEIELISSETKVRDFDEKCGVWGGSAKAETLNPSLCVYVYVCIYIYIKIHK